MFIKKFKLFISNKITLLSLGHFSKNDILSIMGIKFYSFSCDEGLYFFDDFIKNKRIGYSGTDIVLSKKK